MKRSTISILLAGTGGICLGLGVAGLRANINTNPTLETQNRREVDHLVVDGEIVPIDYRLDRNLTPFPTVIPECVKHTLPSARP